MRLRARYIISIFAFLLLGGLCDCYPVSIPIGKYLKQTEWVVYQNRKYKKTKCFRFIFLCHSHPGKNRLTWSEAFITRFNQKLSVILSYLIRFFKCKIIIQLIRQRLYFPRLCIDGYMNSCSLKRAGKELYNHLLSTKWIILRKNLKGKDSGVLYGCRTGCLSSWLHLW